MKASARFKKGDVVVFSGHKYRLQSMKETGTNINKNYTVVSCKEGSSISGYYVVLDEIGRPSRRFCQDWFDLSKSSIVISILSDLYSLARKLLFY